MRKTSILIATLSLLVAAAGCGGDSDGGSASPGGTDNTSSTRSSTTTGPTSSTAADPNPGQSAMATYGSIEKRWAVFVTARTSLAQPVGDPPTLDSPIFNESFVDAELNSRKQKVSDLKAPFTVYSGIYLSAGGRIKSVDNAGSVTLEDCLTDGLSKYDPKTGNGDSIGAVPYFRTVTMRKADDGIWRIAFVDARYDLSKCKNVQSGPGSVTPTFVN